jgi:hypothetical protein
MIILLCHPRMHSLVGVFVYSMGIKAAIASLCFWCPLEDNTSDWVTAGTRLERLIQSEEYRETRKKNFLFFNVRNLFRVKVTPTYA